MSSRRQRAWGEGTIHKRSDGRWMGQLFVTESLTGARVRRAIYGRSRGEVESKMQELIDLEAKGSPIPPQALTVGDYMEEWLSTVVSVRVRPTTLAGYRYHFERHLMPGLGSRKLARLSAREVRVFLDGLRQAGSGPRTVQYVHATLRAALEDAVREEIIGKNVAKLVRVPRPEQTVHIPLDVDEVRTLLRATKEDRLHPMYTVFALLGMRRSEVLGLKWVDVDLDARALRIERGLQRVEGRLQTLPTKTARSRRTIPLPGVIVDVLRRQRALQAEERLRVGPAWQESGFVFTTPIGTPIDPRNCTRLVQAACKRAGLRVVRLHDFRHGCVSVLLALGVPPRTTMEIVGHTTLEITMNVYGHVTLDDKRQALDRLGDLFGDSGEGVK